MSKTPKPDEFGRIRVRDLDTGHERSVHAAEFAHGNYELLDGDASDALGNAVEPVLATKPAPAKKAAPAKKTAAKKTAAPRKSAAAKKSAAKKTAAPKTPAPDASASVESNTPDGQQA